MSTQHTQQLKEARVRKPRARPKDAVMGGIYERLAMLDSTQSIEEAHIHSARLWELLNELRLATSKEPAGEE